MIFFRAVKYLRYIFLARYSKGHGMHSPFIFDLVSRILWNKTDNDVVCSIEKVRKKLISDHRLIKISDLGSAKYRKTTNNRKVSEIARYSPVPSKYGQLLSNLATEFGKPMILELGTSFGISTMYLASGSPETVIYTIEGSAEISEIASRNFTDTGMKNIKTLTGSFDEMLPVVFAAGVKPGLVFIDGDHRKESVLRYFDKIAEVSDTNTVIVIDDIYYSREMEEAWNEIKIDEKVSVTVDIFRMGIVFFRRGMSHQNYIVRH
jgi:predicted O-methyltransferase YrrM